LECFSTLAGAGKVNSSEHCQQLKNFARWSSYFHLNDGSKGIALPAYHWLR